MKDTSFTQYFSFQRRFYSHIILGNSFPTLPSWRLRIHIRILEPLEKCGVKEAAKHEVTDSQTHFTLESLSHVIPDHPLEQLLWSIF